MEIIRDLDLEAVKHYAKAEGELIEILQKFDQLKGYLALGYRSLFDYCTSALKLSESQSSALENQDEWFQKAKDMSHRALEKEVARVCPQTSSLEFAQYRSENRLDLHLSISEKLYEKLKRIQDFLNLSSLEEALEEVSSDFIQRKDPVEKARRAEKRKLKVRSARNVKVKKTSQIKIGTPDTRNRERLSAGILNIIHRRDEGSCQFLKPDGNLCGSRRYLHIHHKIPVFQGGTNDPENLVTYCGGHHRLWHYQHTPKILNLWKSLS